MQEMDFTAVLVLATLRTSQMEAVEAATHSARTHQTGRTPNIPGDTPWTRAGMPTLAGLSGFCQSPPWSGRHAELRRLS